LLIVYTMPIAAVPGSIFEKPLCPSCQQANYTVSSVAAVLSQRISSWLLYSGV
jgi:hypothetical protein